jgi:hypothetical protein
MEIRPSLMGDTVSVKWGGEVDTTPAGFQKQQQRHTRCRNPATTTATTGGIPEILGIPEFNLEIRKFRIQNSVKKNFWNSDLRISEFHPLVVVVVLCVKVVVLAVAPCTTEYIVDFVDHDYCAH